MVSYGGPGRGRGDKITRRQRDEAVTGRRGGGHEPGLVGFVP